MNQDQFLAFLKATLSVNPDVIESEILDLERAATHGDHLHTHETSVVYVKLANGDTYLIGGTPVPFEL